MQGRVIVHLVPQVRLVRSHAIHKAHQLFAVHQHPKMVRIQRQPSGKAQFCGGFGSGEALGFNLYHSCQIGGSRGSDLHNNSPYFLNASVFFYFAFPAGCCQDSCSMIFTISLSVSRIPSRPSWLTLRIVFSTPLVTMPSPPRNCWPFWYIW